MSKLIDTYIRENTGHVPETFITADLIRVEVIPGISQQFLAKPLNKKSFKERVKDAYRILRNKSFAVHYKEDE